MRSSSLRVLGLFGILIFLFVIPGLGAWYLYGNSHKGVSFHTTNHGNLIQPGLTISQFQLRTQTAVIKEGEIFPHHWWLLYINPVSCENQCQQHLYLMRQLRLSTGKDMDRIERAIVSLSRKDPNLDTLLEKDYAGTHHFYMQAQQLKTLPEAAGGELALKQGYLYLVDPHGNIVLGYTLETKIQDIYQDLTHLLKTSQIG
jgi:hypothetical protein